EHCDRQRGLAFRARQDLQAGAADADALDQVPDTAGVPRHRDEIGRKPPSGRKGAPMEGSRRLAALDRGEDALAVEEEPAGLARRPRLLAIVLAGAAGFDVVPDDQSRAGAMPDRARAAL